MAIDDQISEHPPSFPSRRVVHTRPVNDKRKLRLGFQIVAGLEIFLKNIFRTKFQGSDFKGVFVQSGQHFLIASLRQNHQFGVL